MSKYLALSCAVTAALFLRVQQLEQRVGKTEEKTLEALRCKSIEVINDTGNVVFRCDSDPKTKGGRVRLFDAKGVAASDERFGAPQPGPAENTTSAIETKLDGDLEELDYDHIYKMTNGQIWQQLSAHYEYHYAYMPDVLIYRSGRGWKMLIAGCKKAVEVQQLK